MRFLYLLLVITLTATVAVLLTRDLTPTSSVITPVLTESVYERVMRTGTLRCGYFEEAPFTMIDPNTEHKSGIAVELAETIASDLGLKIEWAGVTNFGTLAEDLRTGRFDAICASLFSLPRAGRVGYTIPYTFVPVYGYTTAGRTDFDNKWDAIDWTQVTIAGLDGEGSTTVAQKKLPNAHFAVLPQNSQIADMLTSVIDHKADMGFVMPTVFNNFDKANPGKLQKIATDRPFYVFNVSFGVKPDEPAFKNMLDFDIRNLATNGTLAAIFDKYDPDNLLFRPAEVYKLAK